MRDCIHLNIYRHPAIPVLRGQERHDQADDPVFRTLNDDVDEDVAPGQMRLAARGLDLAPDLSLSLWHSDTRRTRRGAALLAAALHPRWTPLIMEVPELGEPAFELRALVDRDAFEDPNRPPWLVRHAFFTAVIEDDRSAVAEGRAGIARRVLRLGERVGGLGPVNLLWVTHGLLMPFLHLTYVDGVAPDDWTLSDVLAVGLMGYFGYGEGFSHRLPIVRRDSRAAATVSGHEGGVV